ncbi:hypothetical protein ACWEN3_15595, partial [Streptomyces sp. NPDC004561]
MLRILDARTGEPVAAAPARRGLTRIEAHACGLDLTALRVLLTVDLLVRALELGGTPVWAALATPCDRPELRNAATALAIRPFEDGRDLASGLGAAQVIHVLAESTDPRPAEGPLAAVAHVTWHEPEPLGHVPGGSDSPRSASGRGTGPAGDACDESHWRGGPEPAGDTGSGAAGPDAAVEAGDTRCGAGRSDAGVEAGDTRSGAATSGAAMEAGREPGAGPATDGSGDGSSDDVVHRVPDGNAVLRIGEGQRHSVTRSQP